MFVLSAGRHAEFNRIRIAGQSWILGLFSPSTQATLPNGLDNGATDVPAADRCKLLLLRMLFNHIKIRFQSLIIVQYGATIFQSVGISDSYVTQIILGAVNFSCTLGGLYVMEHVSHAWSLLPRLSRTDVRVSLVAVYP